MNYIIFLIVTLFSKIIGQIHPNLFEGSISKSFAKSKIFSPCFASSGETWNETYSRSEKYYTCDFKNLSGFVGEQPISSLNEFQYNEGHTL